MPLYQYRCQSCGAEEEHIQKFSDDPLTECSACKGQLVRLISGAAFHLKGGGWYKDGYASARPDSGGSADSGSDAKSGDGGGKTSESTTTKKDAGGDKPKAAASSGSKAANE